MGRHDDGEAAAAFMVALTGILVLGVGLVLKVLVSWIIGVHERSAGHPAIPIAWVTLLISGVITLLFALGHLVNAAAVIAGIGFCLFLFLLALVDVQSRDVHKAEDAAELPLDDVLSLPWWDDRH